MPLRSAKNTLPKVSTKPTSSDASSAPVIEPMPPITTSTKQMMSTLVASLLVGFVDTFGKVFFADLSGIGIYLLMAIVLIWKPEGLMGRRP